MVTRRLISFALIPAALVFAAAPPNTEREKGAPMPAAEAAARFGVPPGFRVTVFAAEPDVQNPIACCWDPKGRLWVAENYTYAERPQRFDLTLFDRIVIFEDKGVGKPPVRTVFCDNLQMLTSVEVGLGGVWAMCPPRLLFVPTKDDKPAGPPEVVLDGFTVAAENYHNFANGLKWGPDGWLYGRCGASCPGKLGVPGTPDAERIPIHGGIWRYHPNRKVVEVLCHGTTNPWGHDWDERGECFFVNTVNGHLWHMIPGAHYARPHTIDPNPYVYHLIDQHADHYHWDTSQKWEDSRDAKGEHGRRGGGHAHVGAMIYKGDQWPAEYRGKLLTCNLHGRRVNVERLARKGSGFVGKHEPDMLFAADPFFRGMELTCGPDGSVFILDWSDTGECHENTGVHRTSGRIYRVGYGEARSDRASVTPGWLPPRSLRRFEPSDESSRCDICKQLAMRNSHEAVRVRALRDALDEMPIDTIRSQPRATEYPRNHDFRRMMSMAQDDPSGLVRLALGSSLQRMPIDRRAELAAVLVARKEDAHDHNLPLLVWYALIPVAKSYPDDLVKVAAACEWPLTRRCVARRLAEDVERRPGPLNELLKVAGEKPREFVTDILAGMAEGLRGWRRAARPQAWETVAAKYADLPAVRDLSVVFGDGRALDEVRRLALDGKADLAVRRSALKTLMNAKPADLRDVCETLLPVQFLNTTAAQGLAQFDDPAVAAALVKNYGKFHPSERPAVLDVFVSRPPFAAALLDAVAAGKIPKADLTAGHARQIAALNDAALTQRLTAVWGQSRPSPAEKRALIDQLKARLSGDEIRKGDGKAGRVVFEKACATCHKLFGAGGAIGPDLTGGDRFNLDYLLQNVVDPSAELAADFRVTRLELKDGRVLLGIVKGRTDQALTLQMEKEQVTVRRGDIESELPTDGSLMPDGLLTPMSASEVRDLFAYLTAAAPPK